jgi:hypothetical protein
MLKEQIKTEATDALKKGDHLVITTLRGLLASISAKEKIKRYEISKTKPESTEEVLIKESEFSDQEVQDAVSSEIKKRKDAIALYIQGNRQELADKEQQEIEILKKYLPEQLSEEKIHTIVKEAIEKTQAKEMKDMGKVMAILNPQIKGKADGGQVSKIVKDLLSK